MKWLPQTEHVGLTPPTFTSTHISTNTPHFLTSNLHFHKHYPTSTNTSLFIHFQPSLPQTFLQTPPHFLTSNLHFHKHFHRQFPTSTNTSLFIHLQPSLPQTFPQTFPQTLPHFLTSNLHFHKHLNTLISRAGQKLTCMPYLR
jgi:hypothetical protein